MRKSVREGGKNSVLVVFLKGFDKYFSVLFQHVTADFVIKKPKGSPDIKKTVKKGDNVTLGEGGGHPQYLFFSPNLPGP